MSIDVLLNVHINSLLSKYETYDVFRKMLFKVYVDLNFKHNSQLFKLRYLYRKKLQCIEKCEN